MSVNKPDGRVVKINYLSYKANINRTSTKYQHKQRKSYNSGIKIGDSVKGLEIKTNALIFGKLIEIKKDEMKNIISYVIRMKNIKREIKCETIQKIPLIENLKNILDFDSFNI